MQASRRSFLKTGGLALAGVVTGMSVDIEPVSAEVHHPLADGPFTLPALGYGYSALEPHIDARTMELHHTRHHQAYITKLNAAVEKEASLKGKSLEELVAGIRSIPESVRSDVRNHGGGHWNHSFFWKVIGPAAPEVPADLGKVIDRDFGSLAAFKEQFTKKAVGVFGSGWAWLIRDGAGKLSITTTPNQDNPLMDIAETKGTPILGVDVWEHAYYLNYQNRRADYLGAFWSIVNWNKVAELNRM